MQNNTCQVQCVTLHKISNLVKWKDQKMTFTTKFDTYVCIGDTIECEIDGYTITATIEHDYDSTQSFNDDPTNRDEGFWPSLNKDDAGWIGDNPEKSYDEQIAHCHAIVEAFKNDEWTFCGIVLSASYNDIDLTDHAASLWGIEMNYPNFDNSYLSKVANELLSEALEEAKNEHEAMKAALT